MLAVTMGDPAGIGGELTLAAWRDQRPAGLPPFLVVDDPARLKHVSEQLGWEVPVHPISRAEEAKECFGEALPVLAIEVPGVICAGVANPANAGAVIGSIEKAVGLAMSGEVGGIVTQPVHKATLYGSGFSFPGHTEFLAYLTG
ncbi:MAG TPA: 4-hydroxythreonine-4-phosphate dehydrogenase PdxA, partial [Alphaproteobacteria bacterium]|nr:4-hydroxythreonine-4-phosphate dehydrogenase PdxA [Alphaproteobacteria bacterium]